MNGPQMIEGEPVARALFVRWCKEQPNMKLLKIYYVHFQMTAEAAHVAVREVDTLCVRCPAPLLDVLAGLWL